MILLTFIKLLTNQSDPAVNNVIFNFWADFTFNQPSSKILSQMGISCSRIESLDMILANNNQQFEIK